MRKINLILFCLLTVSALACGGNSNKTQVSEVVNQVQEGPVLKKGKSVYKSSCMACHQNNGQGIQRVTPPLVNTEWVNGDKSRLVNILLKGFSEKIEVEGVKYNSIMASFSYLSDEEIAAVLTYVRKSFGNSASEITVSEVAAIREAN